MIRYDYNGHLAIICGTVDAFRKTEAVLVKEGINFRVFRLEKDATEVKILAPNCAPEKKHNFVEALTTEGIKRTNIL